MELQKIPRTPPCYSAINIKIIIIILFANIITNAQRVNISPQKKPKAEPKHSVSGTVFHIFWAPRGAVLTALEQARVGPVGFIVLVVGFAGRRTSDKGAPEHLEV